MTDEEVRLLVERAERAEKNCKELALRISAMISNRITGYPYDECLKAVRKDGGLFPGLLEGLEESK